MIFKKCLSIVGLMCCVSCLGSCGSTSIVPSSVEDPDSSNPSTSSTSVVAEEEKTFHIRNLDDLSPISGGTDLSKESGFTPLINHMNTNCEEEIVTGLTSITCFAQSVKSSESNEESVRLTLGASGDGSMHISTSLTKIKSVSVKAQAYYKYYEDYINPGAWLCSVDKNASIALDAIGETKVTESLAETVDTASSVHTISIDFVHNQSSFNIYSAGYDGTKARVFVNEITIVALV